MDAERVVNGFAYIFNRVALGLGVLLGVWSAWHGDWLTVGYVAVLILVYFGLHRYFDAP